MGSVDDDFRENVVEAFDHIRQWMQSITDHVRQLMDALYGKTEPGADVTGETTVHQDLSQKVVTEMLGGSPYRDVGNSGDAPPQ